MISRKIKSVLIIVLPLVLSWQLAAQAQNNSSIWALNPEENEEVVKLPKVETSETQNSATLLSFFAGNYQQAQKKAAAMGKHLVVEIYSSGIGTSCHRMESLVFTNPLVASLYNNNYIVLRLNIDDNTLDPINRQFLNEHRVSFIPSYFYFDEKGEFVTVANGFQDAPKFIEIGQKIIEK